MRTVASPIWDPWLNGGPFIGDDAAPHGVVTVEPDWELNVVNEFHDPYKVEFVRWFQRADNSQDETVIPNVKHIQMTRDIGQPAGTCTITIANQWMDINGTIGDTGDAATPTGGSITDLGNPGYFTFDRGLRPETTARWGHVQNQWAGVLVPNALLRTYQGYGGRNKTTEDALADGNLVRTGVWLVDDVVINASGDLELRCRDTAKLLIDQSFYPPLVPEERYGKKYCRWLLAQKKLPWGSRNPTDRGETGGPVSLTYRDCSENHWYPGYAFNSPSIHGHYAYQALDNDPGTYWLSVGNSAPERSFATNWIEFDAHDQNVNEIYMNPWAGNYDMYISIMEDGDWVGGHRVPYDYTPLIGHQPYVVDTGADIPYVQKSGTPWERGQWYKLGRTYRAQRIRLSFRNQQRSPYGPWYYRAGVREVQARSATTAESPPTYPSTYDMAADPRDGRAGYWVVDDVGNVYAFGDCRKYYRNADSRDIPLISRVRAIEPHPDGLGYWTLQTNGRLIAYGSAAHHGDLYTDGQRIGDAWDFTPTDTGNGYWILRRNGEVSAFGDAIYQGNAQTRAACYTHFKSEQYWGMGIAGHDADGYWIVDGRGEVTARGSATHYGDTGGDGVLVGLLSSSYFLRIIASHTGEGYVILNPAAWPIGYGDVAGIEDVLPNPHLPDADDTLFERFRSLTYGIALNEDDDGFYMLEAQGRITWWGEAEFFGQPGGIQIVRKNGNYKDYADIVKDLIAWAGFLLYDETIVADAGFDSRANVFGNIENTGIYSKECLGADFFDKKPIIDIINQLRDIVGYVFFIDEDGAVHWESPNWWRSGNFDEFGARSTFIPEINEALQLTNYTAAVSGQGLRSEMIISSSDPTVQMDDTITTRFRPPTADLLRGITRPFAWSNGVFQDEEEQRIMAELVALHIFFQMRQGQITCVANPAIQINDQVKIGERTTGDVFVHYVRSISSDMDLESGAYTMTLNTNWLGTSSDDWVITKDQAYEPTIIDPRYPVSDQLLNALSASESRAAHEFGLPDITDATPGGDPGDDDGSGPTDVPEPPPAGALDISSIPTIPTLTEDQPL